MRAISEAGILVVWFFAAATVVGRCGGLSAGVLTLERAFPANQRVELEELRARDRARHARILQGVVGGAVNFAVSGTSDPYLLGLYYTKIKLGSPPKEFNVQIDTGSDTLWVNCNTCADCPRSSGLGIELNFFDAASSTTASSVSCSDPLCTSVVQTTAAECSQSNQCGYSFQYGDGSGTSGFYLSDLLYFDTIMATSSVANSSSTIVFGCSTFLSGDLTKTDKAIDGIFGFGQQDLSVISQLASRRITPKVFSHCLKGEGKGGGKLVLGEIQNPGMVYSPLVPSQPHYNLYLQSIAVNGQLLPIDPAAFTTSINQGTIVDSGTTLAYLVEDAYDPFVSAITAAVSQSATPVSSKGHQCYQVTSSVTEVFPLVSLNFAGGAPMVLRPEDYLVDFGFIDGAVTWCIGFQKVQDLGVTILGDLVLKNKIFVYDLARKRLGWADYDCSLPVNVSTTTGMDEFVSTGQLSVSSSSRNTLFKLISASITLPLHIILFMAFVLIVT
ncbi:aspartic proteinase 36-like [Diospyros lotus]|uniref:aspartic proteinase 36-like n=1 Tax=Diospyros lotus TaxID=55363 RepID=UPI00225AD90B|nr:aspartic proteinase 36-like [Diospyros lotus]